MRCAARSSTSSPGLDHGLRLDFFGDEIETLRLFDPNTQRTVGTVDQHLLLPASEALLEDATVKRFRSRYREMFGATPHRSALSGGERWPPPGRDGALAAAARRPMVTLFDHLAASDLLVIDASASHSAEERLTDIADYCGAARYRGQGSGAYRPLNRPRFI
jgi:transcription-repair coupling factor (superfamily II helicase)